MFSQTTEYALRIAVYLAALGGEPATIAQLAEITKTPQGYLAKVLRSLSRADIVKSQRGLHGGSVLARPADQISILDVINAVDPIKRITTCPLNLPSHGANLCPLHRRLDNALELVEKALADSTLAELVVDPAGSKPLQNDPREMVARAFPVNKPVSLGVKKKSTAARGGRVY
jgi:Rrf2 family nitric oxide-sensitive transcriptional repressor